MTKIHGIHHASLEDVYLKVQLEEVTIKDIKTGKINYIGNYSADKNRKLNESETKLLAPLFGVVNLSIIN